MPIAVVSYFAVFVFLCKELVKAQPCRREGGDGNITIIETLTPLAKLSTIGYGGMLLFLFGVGLLILGLTWAGVAYPWKSAAVFAPIIIGGVSSFSLSSFMNT